MTTSPPDPATKTRAGRAQLLLIPFAALIAVMPLLHHGCSCGHDFDFHLLNWMEAARQFSHGTLHPHWAFTPAFNAGEPRFVFYPPISWYLGATLGLILTHLPGLTETAAWTAAPILFTWIALTLSGLTFHRLARVYLGPNAALLAAILYLANPYMLFTAYERTAYAELLAAAWIPLLLLAILRDRPTIPGIATPVALLWLTNAPAAVMGSYTLALLALIRIVATGRTESTEHPPSTAWTLRHANSLRLAITTAAGTLLGLALAAFYIIPAEFERRFVQIAMATISGMRIDQNFLFEHTGTSSDALLHDQVLHTASTIAILLLLATAAALLLSATRKPRTHLPLASLTLLAADIAFLITPLSLPLWLHTPQAAFLQFPWRLLAILAPVFALSAGAAVDQLPHKLRQTAIAGLLLAVLLSHPAYHAFQQPCDTEDTPAARLALFHSTTGTDPTDEYTPAAADNDSLSQDDPPYWLAASPSDPPPAGAQPGPAPMHIALATTRPEDLILNLRNYPAWQIRLNGLLETPRPSRPDGLIAIPIPSGPSTLDIRYAHTPDQTVGDATSVLALALILFRLRRGAV